MEPADYAVLGLYLLGMIGVGVYYARRNVNLSQMFSAGGQAPWWVAGLSGFMTMFSAGTFVVWGGIAYQHGLVAVVINLAYGVAALIVGFIAAGRWRSMGLRTPAQYVELRFGKRAVALYLGVMMVFRLIGAGTALYALSVLLAALIPLPDGHLLQDLTTGNLSVVWATVIFGAIVVLYTMAGGLWAVLMTDVLQFIILNLAVLFIVPLILANAGGAQAALDALPEAMFQLTGGGYGWWFVAGWTAIHIFMIGAEWAFVQRFIAVPSPAEARKSAFLFGGLYLVSPIIWLAPPILYRAVDASAPPEQAYILAAQSVLPAGMLGLMIAAMFSATASLVSSQLNVFAGVVTDLVAKRRGSADGPAAVWTGRSVTLALGTILVALAAAVPLLGGAEALIISATSLLVGPLLAPSLWGLLGRRIDGRSIWVSVGAAIIVGIIVRVGLAEGGVLASMPGLSSVALWVQSNGPLTDLSIGVLTPLVVLSIMQATARTDSIGAQRIDALKAQAQGAFASAASRDPLIVVAVALFASAGVTVTLALFSPDDRHALLGFSAALAVLALTFWGLWRPARSRRHEPAKPSKARVARSRVGE